MKNILNDEILLLKKLIDEKKDEIFQLKSIIDDLPVAVYWKYFANEKLK